ncbi:MAG: Polysaccharide biosynthesis protein [Candidatus Magasanikbacteria bacterium GW2011_GWC2_34_16]|uniref:Polysaccharide biosynthesis protein n=1 Tax=Candidatus Magasanikbacteria bacterium GW2011_GWC2_34_16 TaxID=1619045 RepID=A0A0G0AQU1_9BACT|nr:MAG: Polysaccharide biosynthesis protein [Candidatus Magasanikbacteria bacterium GW2011_GWC2_34_16]
MNKLTKNYLFSISYQILLIVVPLITTPHLSRTLGPEGIGIYSYTATITMYFSLIGFLGIMNYGNRQIAQNKSSKKILSATFSEIYSFQIYSFFIIIIIYIFYAVFFSSFKIIMVVWLFQLLAAALDITWFYFGIEKFNIAITRNIIVKILSVILIFVLVRDSSNLVVYIAILSFGTLFSQIFLWLYLPKFAIFKLVSIRSIRSHFKPLMILFVPIIAVSIYTIFGKLILGAFIGFSDTGVFENSLKIMSLPTGVITALGVVMLPRATSLVKENNHEELDVFTKKSIDWSLYLSIGMTFGLILIAPQVIPIFLGEGFENSVLIVSILSISIPFISIANVFRTQYILPYEKDKIYVKSVIFGAITNLLIIFSFVKWLGIVGVALGVVASEFVVFTYQYFHVREVYQVKKMAIKSILFILSGLSMLLVIQKLDVLFDNILVLIFMQIFLGFIVYSVFSMVLVKVLSKSIIHN